MTAIDYKNITVLLIDDDRYTRRLVTQVLLQIGIGRIVEAQEGTEGLVAVVDHTPDVIICDIAMQPMDGVTFLRELRAGGGSSLRQRVPNPDVPVIFLSGQGTETALREAMVLGVDSVISKPPSLAILKKRIDFVLMGQMAAAQR